MLNSLDYISPTVDWLTMTVFQPQARERLDIMATQLILDAHDKGERSQVWSWKGYRGWSLSHFSYGSRPADSIAIVKGRLAEELWYSFGQLARNISRMDIAVTVALQTPDEDVARNAWIAVQQAAQKAKLPRDYTYITNLNGGATLYVGRRSSDQFGRLYDKSAQRGDRDPGSRWRYEVEYKKPRSKMLFDTLAQTVHVNEAICSAVWSWFQERNVEPIFDCPGASYIIEREARVSSAEITLSWLRSQVRPAIIRLIKEGHIERVQEALQLPLFHEIPEEGGHKNGNR